MKKFNENGRSMIEMLGVLAIIGVLSAGGLAGYAKAMFRHRLNSTLDQITMLTTNIRTMYGTQSDYTGLPKDAISLNLIPTSMIPVESTVGTDSLLTLKSPFKGDVDLETSSINGDPTTATEAPNSAFVITYKTLPREACVALATADFGAGAGSGFVGVCIDTGEACTSAHAAKVGEGFASSRAEGVPYSVTEALEECDEAEDGNATVSWKFY